jgi:hypothetical protein
MLFHDHYLQSYHYEKKDIGYAKRNKRHAQASMMKKRRRREKEGKERKKDTPYPRKREKEIKERWFMKRSSYTHPPKLSTHMYILIKVYDLFLLWI